MACCSFYALRGACWFCVVSRPLSFAMQCFCSCDAALFGFASHHIALSFCGAKLCVFASHSRRSFFLQHGALFVFATQHFLFCHRTARFFCGTELCFLHHVRTTLSFCSTALFLFLRRSAFCFCIVSHRFFFLQRSSVFLLFLVMQGFLFFSLRHAALSFCSTGFLFCDAALFVFASRHTALSFLRCGALCF